MSEETAVVETQEPMVGIQAAFDKLEAGELVVDNDGVAEKNTMEEMAAETPPPVKKEAVQETVETTKEEVSTTDTEADEDVGFGYQGEETVEEDAKPEELDEAAFDAETETESKGVTDAKANAAFKRNRQALKEAKLQLSKMKSATNDAEIAELREKAAEVEELKQKVADLTDVSYEVKLRAEKEWKDEYEKPVAASVAKVESLAQDFEVSQEALAKLVLEPNARTRVVEIGKLLADSETEDGDVINRSEERQALISEIKGVSDSYHLAMSKRDELTANAKEKFEAIEARRVDETKAQREARTKVHRQQVSNLSADLKEKFGEQMKDYADALEVASKRASQLTPESMSGPDGAYAAWSGAVLPSLLKQINKQAATIAKLTGTKVAERESSVNLNEGEGAEDKGKATGFESIGEAFAKMNFNQ